VAHIADAKKNQSTRENARGWPWKWDKHGVWEDHFRMLLELAEARMRTIRARIPMRDLLKSA
jgi:hypothetical protein